MIKRAVQETWGERPCEVSSMSVIRAKVCYTLCDWLAKVQLLSPRLSKNDRDSFGQVSLGTFLPRLFVPCHVSTTQRHGNCKQLIIPKYSRSIRWYKRVRITLIESLIYDTLQQRPALVVTTMPAEVQRVRAADIETSTGQTEGMIRQGAIVDKSDKVCASGMFYSSGHGYEVLK